MPTVDQHVVRMFCHDTAAHTSKVQKDYELLEDINMSIVYLLLFSRHSIELPASSVHVVKLPGNGTAARASRVFKNYKL